jgi:hypothetical protein
MQGGDDDCSCVDPTMALPNEQTKGWVKAHNQNKMLVKNVNNLNTVFLGDQFMEQWNAQVHGAPTNEYKAVKSYFEQTFNPPKGDIHGVSLGIAGDMVSLPREFGNKLLPSNCALIPGKTDFQSYVATTTRRAANHRGC